MLIKLAVLILFGFILFSLGSAMFHMLKNQEQPTQSVKALTWRIGLSIAAFLILMVSYKLGFIEPHAAIPK